MTLRILIPIFLSFLIAACGGSEATNPNEDNSNWVAISADTSDSYIAVKINNGVWESVSNSSNLGFDKRTLQKLSVIKFCTLSDMEKTTFRYTHYDNVVADRKELQTSPLNVGCDNSTTFTIKLPTGVYPSRVLLTDALTPFNATYAANEGLYDENKNEITIKTARTSGTVSLNILLYKELNYSYVRYELDLDNHPVTDNIITVTQDALTSPALVDIDEETQTNHYFFTGLVSNKICFNDDVEASYFNYCWKPKFDNGLYNLMYSHSHTYYSLNGYAKEMLYSNSFPLSKNIELESTHTPTGTTSVQLMMGAQSKKISSIHYFESSSNSPTVRAIKVADPQQWFSIEAFGAYAPSSLLTITLPDVTDLPEAPQDIRALWDYGFPSYLDVTLQQSTASSPKSGSTFFESTWHPAVE